MSATFTPIPASLANILVAIDFSDRSHLAAQFATSLAHAKHGARVCIVNVIPPAPLDQAIAHWPTQSRAIEENRHERLRDFVSDIDFAGIRLSFDVRVGELTTALEDLSVEEGTDVIVIASRGREGAEKLVHGSNAELIMRHALCPVLVVGPHVSENRVAKDHIRHVLFATDFGLGSVHAFPYAVEIARSFYACLTVLHVFERTPVPDEYGNENFLEQSIKSARQEVQDMLPKGVTCEAVVEPGVPWEEIVRAASRRDADLIVTGRRPHSPTVAAHTPWTTAHRLICHAPCPVLTVR